MTVAFSVSRLGEILAHELSIAAGDRIAVAFSGGVDSTVLLNALAIARETQPFELRALHVNHGLHPQSQQWSDFCAQVCGALQIRFDSGRVDVATDAGSIESAARDARYGWLESVMQPGECLALAHHADDQLETLLFRLVRGAGARGMTGMAADTTRNGVRLIRPLLQFSRAQLRDWAEQRQIKWIDDPANDDADFDRVYLRRQVVPLLVQRWPGAPQQATRSSAYIADVVAIADERAHEDLLLAQPNPPLFARSPGLSCEALSALAPRRLNHALRQWCLSLTATPIPRGRLTSLIELVLSTATVGEIRFADVLIRRYRDGLYIQRSDLPSNAAEFEARSWRESMAAVDMGAFRLTWHTSTGDGVSRRRLDALARPTLRLARPSDSLQIRHAGHLRSFRQLCQRLAVPGWDRAWLPLLTGPGDELIAIAGVVVDDRWLANGAETGVSFELSRLHGLDLD